MCITSWVDKVDFRSLTSKEKRDLKKKLQSAASKQMKKHEVEMGRINGRIDRLSRSSKAIPTAPRLVKTG